MRISDFSMNTPLAVAPDAETQKKMDNEQAKGVAREFETMFLDMMLKSMRKAIPVSEEQQGALPLYQEMLDSEYAKNMSAHEDMGIQSMIYEWITASRK